MQAFCKECKKHGHFKKDCPNVASNVRVRTREPFDKALFDEWLEPDFEKGVLLWKKMPTYSVLPGHQAGGPSAHGNIRFRLRGSNYEAHQVLWFLYTGKDSVRVYHKNQDIADNRISNLTDRPPKVEKPKLVKPPKEKEIVEPIPVKEKPEVDYVEVVMAEEARTILKSIQPRRDPMIWSMFGGANA